MIWDSTGYKEVHFDKEKYSLNQLKLYDENSINNFHKTTPSCDTVLNQPLICFYCYLY